MARRGELADAKRDQAAHGSASIAPHSEGVVLKGVQRSSPAGKAGLEPGDVMLTINGQPVKSSRAMLNQISQLPPGTGAKVKVSREGKEVDVQVTVGERPQPQLPKSP